MRSMDFAGAFHCDFFRFSDIVDQIARWSYPKGCGGDFSFLIGTMAIESYGASKFIRANNGLDLWCNDERSRAVPKLWPCTKTYDEDVPAEAPTQKMYHWFESQWRLKEDIEYNVRMHQWELALGKMEGLCYGYYRDQIFAMMVFEFLLYQDMKDDLKHYFFDNKKVMANIEFQKTLDEWPAFWALKKINNYFQYFAAIHVIEHLLKSDLDDNDVLDNVYEMIEIHEGLKVMLPYMMAEGAQIAGGRVAKKRMTVLGTEGQQIWARFNDI